MSTITIRRGMVFFLEKPYEGTGNFEVSDGPTKKRPYIVLSNDKCNDTSPNIHVAPIFTATDKSLEKWYRIPFRSTCNRLATVDIGSVMLVSRELFTEANYSPAISQYTINNTNLMNNIGRALVKQFGFEPSQFSTTTCVPTTFDTPTEKNTIPTLNLVININGVSVPTENITVEQESTPTTKPETKPETTMENEPSQETETQRNYYFKSNPEVTEFIKNNDVRYGGTMNKQDVADALGISVNALYYHYRKIEKDSYVGFKKKKSSNPGREKLPKSEYKKFMEDHEKCNTPKMIELYRKYGITTPKQVYNYVWRIRKYLTENVEK